MKKKIIIIVAAILVVALVITGLVFFLNRNKDTEDPVLTPSPTETVQPDATNSPEPTPPPDEPIPDYLDMYESYTDLNGVSFNVPKNLLKDAVDHSEVTGTLNGKTVLYTSNNTFGIKKIGSFIIGVAFYENPGVFDAMYVSSITGQKELRITDDMVLNFKDINFNSTSFTSKKVDANQKVAVISLRMVEPEYTQDTYKGYMVLAVNSKNQGYLMFIATTESEYMMVDVQSMVNSLQLTGDTLIPEEPAPTPETPQTQVETYSMAEKEGFEKVSFKLTRSTKSLSSGMLYITNLDNHNTLEVPLSNTEDVFESTFYTIPGDYQVMCMLPNSDGSKSQVTLDNDIVTVTAGTPLDLTGTDEVKKNSTFAIIEGVKNFDKNYNLLISLIDANGTVSGTLDAYKTEGTTNGGKAAILSAGTYTIQATLDGNPIVIENFENITIENGHYYSISIKGVNEAFSVTGVNSY